MALPVDPSVPMPAPQPGAVQPQPPQKPAERVVSPEDKALAADYLKRIQAAKDRPQVVAALKTFARNRKLLRGIDPDNNGKKFRTNLFFADMAMMRPQVYAKDPEYSIKPTAGVSEKQLPLAKKFASTCEVVLSAELVKGCKLKKRAKRLLTSTFATSVGWWKLIFQEDKRTDPVVMNQIKDTQDELMRLQALRDSMNDPQSLGDADKKAAELTQMLAGLQSNSEITVSRGLALDFVLAEDILILDASVREMADYERAAALSHRIWFTRSSYRTRFGYEPKGTRTFTEANGPGANAAGTAGASVATARDDDLFEVHEVWDQEKSRVFHVCVGEEGFCDAPTSPDWTGERWIPFFLLMFNETDGDMFPLSDIELTEELVREYNEARSDLVRDRRDSLPFTVVRKGGSLTPKDVENIRNRRGNDIVEIEGNGGNSPLANDIQALTLGKIDPANYNTQPARADIEQLIGGGDAARGSVMEAKTATEAEILSQGLRGRSAERQDIMEDVLTDLGANALQILLRKLTTQEVQAIAGSDAQWPQALGIDEIFRMVTLEVRSGSTGKPDRLQDQDRWTKLLPVIEKTVEQVSELREKGQNELAGALVELTRETLRRFDERLDIEQFLPKVDPSQQVNPAALAQENQQLKQQAQEQDAELTKLKQDQEKAEMTTAATLATSANPLAAIQAFSMAMQIIESVEQSDDGTGQPAGAVQQGLMAKLQQMLAGAQVAQAPQPGAPAGAAPGGPPMGMPPQIPQAPAQTGPTDPNQPQ